MGYSKAETEKKQRKLVSKTQRNTRKVLVILFKIILVGIIAVIIAGAGAGFGMMKGILDNAPDTSSINIVPQGYRSNIRSQDGTVEKEISTIDSNRVYVYYDQIPKDMVNAFVAIEDQRFWTHNGIDVRGIFRAFAKGAASGHFNEGASTLTQQRIKNQVFNAGLDETTFMDKLERKIQEQYLALKLDEIVDNKKLILENYLNTINLGNNNLGVQSAARNYFNKDVSELTISESSVIAAITQNPSKYNPVRHPDKNAERRNTVLKYMYEQKLITKAEYDEALADDVYARIQNIHSSAAASTAYSYYTDALVQDDMEDLMAQKGYTYTQAYNLVYRGGRSIYSCEDSELQDYAESVINDPNIWNQYVSYAITYRFQVRDQFDNLSSYTESSMLKYLKEKYGSEFALMFSSTEDTDKYAEEYKNHVLEQTGGEIINGSETITYTMQPQTSLTVIENGTGEVRVIIGGRGDKTESLTLNRATSSERQAGSTIKPLIVYSRWEGVLSSIFERKGLRLKALCCNDDASTT